MSAPVFAEWAILELLGHRRLAGYVSEQTIAGHGFLRIDVPDGEVTVTQLYAPSSVYGITPVTEDVARAVAARNRPQPMQAWELRALTPPRADDVDVDQDDDEWDDGGF